jgi:AcrR family transcriptional regulator
MPARRLQPHRTPLTRERVIDAGLALADAHGIDALTMRRLGQELGVEAMSLYNHVANKEDLVAALLDAVVGEYALPSRRARWKPALRASAISANQVLQRHPWAPGSLITFGAMPGPKWLRWSEELLGTLRRAGFSPEATHHAFHILEGHIYGSALRQVNFRPTAAELATMAQGFLATIDVTAHPWLVEHIEGHVRGAFRSNGYELGLDLILDGLEKMLPTSP